jgi:hypothetical protein
LFKVNVSARRRHSVKSTAQQDWSRRPLSTHSDDRATRGRAARRKHETRVRLPTIRPADVPVTNTPRRPTSATTAPPTGRVVPRRDRPRHRSDYELFNRNNFNIRYWSWNYRGCWHQTCPPIDPRLKVLKCSHSDYGASDESRIVIFRHYLPVPGVGNLRACCLPWMW